MKRLLLFLVTLLAFCGRASATLPSPLCDTVSSDNFTRANENPLSNHGYWATQSGAQNLQISSNKALPTSTSNTSRALWIQAWYPNNQCSTLTLSAIGANSVPRVMVRMSGGAVTGYEFLCTPTVWFITKLIAGVQTNLTNGSAAFTAGDQIAITVVGTTITGYKNGTSLGSATDSAITQGSPGFGLADTVSTANNKASAWTAGGSFTGVWTKLGPILSPNSTDYNSGSFFSGTSNGTALYEGNPQLIGGVNVFKIWFQGSSDLFYAECDLNLNCTRRPTAVLSNVGLPKIFKNAGIYYLYASPTPTCGNCVVSSYTSSDGITWTLQVATALGHGPHTFDDVAVQYMMPFHFDGTTWYATYSGEGSVTSGIGIATSTDLLHWTNGAASLFGGGAPDTHEIGGIFYSWTAMFDEAGNTGVGGGRQQSNDMVTWSAQTLVQPRTLFMEGLFASGGSGALGPQSLVEANGNVYSFYTGTRGENLGRGYVMMAAVATGKTLATLVATSEGPVFPQTDPQVANLCSLSLASDNFTRANETPLSNSGNWSIAFTPNVQINLVSNNAQATSTTQLSHMIWTGRTWNPNQCSQQTISGLASTSANALSVRATTAASTFYIFFVTPTNFGTSKRIAGSLTTIHASDNNFPFAVGDTIAVNISGQTINSYKSGSGITTMIDSVRDSSIASGSPGIILSDTATAANSKASAWQGGQGASNTGTSVIIVQ